MVHIACTTTQMLLAGNQVCIYNITSEGLILPTTVAFAHAHLRITSSFKTQLITMLVWHTVVLVLLRQLSNRYIYGLGLKPLMHSQPFKFKQQKLYHRFWQKCTPWSQLNPLSASAPLPCYFAAAAACMRAWSQLLVVQTLTCLSDTHKMASFTC